jgi:hypothetical protein
METVQKRINFYCQPFGFEKSEHAIEKDNKAGAKGRYLKGIASGSKIDGTGERITENAIKSMMEQAKSGEILLYADRHNVMHSNDIGKMTDQSIMPNGDWLVEFKLYEPADGMGANTDETVNKIWKQLKGLPPYTKPRQRGFSIEGFIPDAGILQMSDDGTNRIIDDVKLDGVVLVTRPAYETSIASAIYKALEERMPHQVRKEISNKLNNAVRKAESNDNYYKQRYRLQDIFSDEIENIMKDGGDQFALESLFEEYAIAMMELLQNNKGAFLEESNTESVDEVETLYNVSKGSPEPKNKLTIYKDLLGQLNALEKQLN